MKFWAYIDMKYIGALVLINIILISGYFTFFTQVSGKRIAIFGTIGIFLGIAIMLSDRITGVKVSGIGEISTAVEKATSGAEEVEKIRADVEKHRDTIALIVRDANEARNDINEVAEISAEAKAKAEKIAEVLSEAQRALQEIKTVSDFSLLLTKASNDDRTAFDSILEIAKNRNHQFYSLANQALLQIITDPQVTGLLTYRIDWGKDHNLDPNTATWEEFLEVYRKEIPFRWPSVLSTMWKQDRFAKSKRIEALYDVIKTTISLKCLHKACKLINEEAKLDKNILAYDEYLRWWEQNRVEYMTKENAQEKH
jgi:hypothetical protein